MLLYGCSKEAGAPLSFYLGDQDQGGAATIPTNSAALVVTQVDFVASDADQRKINIKLMPADAHFFEKLTTDNPGKTLTIVQGDNVLAIQKVSQPIPAWAGITFPISPNRDSEKEFSELLKLSRQFK